MERIVEKTVLYDFYGELLTKRQQEIFEAVVFNDMTLSEAANEYGISRQGVSDLLRRSEETLLFYESHIHSIEQFEKLQSAADELQSIAETLPQQEAEKLGKLGEKIRKIIG